MTDNFMYELMGSFQSTIIFGRVLHDELPVHGIIKCFK